MGLRRCCLIGSDTIYGFKKCAMDGAAFEEEICENIWQRVEQEISKR